MESNKPWCVLIPLNKRHSTVHLTEEISTFGRDEKQCEYVLQNKWTSRLHCKIQRHPQWNKNNKFIANIIDLSKHGVYTNVIGKRYCRLPPNKWCLLLENDEIHFIRGDNPISYKINKIYKIN